MYFELMHSKSIDPVQFGMSRLRKTCSLIFSTIVILIILQRLEFHSDNMSILINCYVAIEAHTILNITSLSCF